MLFATENSSICSTELVDWPQILCSAADQRFLQDTDRNYEQVNNLPQI